MEKNWTKSILANNLKFLRIENSFSQKTLAKKTDVSYRLIQEIESGLANPTLETLEKIAMAFKITVEDLISLSQVRLLKGDVNFIERFALDFKSANIAVGVRNLDGIVLWANQLIEKLHGGNSFDNGPVDLRETYSNENHAILKTQMAAEKLGLAYPYTLAHTNPKSAVTLYLRHYPTLIFPNKGHIPVYTSIYLTEINDDCAINYFEYCSLLLGVIYKKNPHYETVS